MPPETAGWGIAAYMNQAACYSVACTRNLYIRTAFTQAESSNYSKECTEKVFDIELPLAGVEVWAPGITILGMSIGMLTGIFGAGGGFLLIPIMKVLFGVPYSIAIGSGLLQIVITAAFSVYNHWRNGAVDLKLGLILSVGAMCGAELGVRLLELLGAGGVVTIHGATVEILDLVLNLLFLVLLSIVCISIIIESVRSAGEEPSRLKFVMKIMQTRVWPMADFAKSGIRMSLWAPFILALGVGVLTGLLGVGGGFINFPLLVYVVGAPTLVAVGTSAFQIVFASAYGAFRHALEGNVELALVGLLLLGSLPGVRFGVAISRRIGGLRIRRWFAVVILLGIILITWDLLRQLAIL